MLPPSNSCDRTALRNPDFGLPFTLMHLTDASESGFLRTGWKIRAFLSWRKACSVLSVHCTWFGWPFLVRSDGGCYREVSNKSSVVICQTQKGTYLHFCCLQGEWMTTLSKRPQQRISGVGGRCSWKRYSQCPMQAKRMNLVLPVAISKLANCRQHWGLESLDLQAGTRWAGLGDCKLVFGHIGPLLNAHSHSAPRG